MRLDHLLSKDKLEVRSSRFDVRTSNLEPLTSIIPGRLRLITAYTLTLFSFQGDADPGGYGFDFS